MGNRLTLPLLFLAALLAGGAFFWMTGEERRSGSGGRGGGGERPAPAETRPPAELVAPALPIADEPAETEEPARIEVARTEDAPKAPKARSTNGVALRGRVVDRFGTPLPGAKVTIAADTGFPVELGLERELSWMKRQRALTDAEGRFRFESVDPGSLQVAVRATGFAPYEQRGLAVAASDTELEPFALVRGAILAGIVVDPDGRGVPGAKILSEDLETGRDVFLIGEREPTAVTGSDGRFRVETLACGAWRFRVRSEDHPDLTVEGVSAEPVEQGGLRWQLAPGATIAGTVTGIPAAERGQLEVRAARRGHGDDFFLGLGAARTAKVEGNGTFVVRGLEPGQTYTLEARRAEFQEDSFFQRSRSNSIQARAGDSGVVLSYQPEAALVFTVHDAATRAPLERFEVESGIDWPQPLNGEDGRRRRVFPGGAVRVGGLRPSSDQERAQLRVNATGYREYERTDIAVRAGQELDLGALYLERVPVVRVRVLDPSGAPVVGANVRMQKQPDGSFEVKRSISIGDDEGVEAIELGDSRSGTTDADGWAEITSFEGETVVLSARAAGYAPARLAGVFLPRAESIEQELRMTPGGEVLVRVLDAQGAPLAGARVEHRAEGAGPEGGVFVLGGSRGGGEVTDSTGQVLFSNLAAGAHSFRLGEKENGGGFFHGVDATVVIPGLAGADGGDWTEVQVGEGERGEVTLRAAPRASLAGRVREAGKVLPGATLHLEKEKAGARPRGLMLPGMESGPEAKSDGEGRYAIDDVKEGRYVLKVEHPTRRMPQEFPIELDEGENTFDVELTVSVISGRVLDEQGKGIQGVRVWPERRAADDGSGVRFTMMILDDSGGGGGVIDSGQFGERAYTDAEGRYTLRGVTSDADLVIRAEGDSVQPGQSEVLRVAPDEVKEGVDLALSAAGKILVEAKLADGSPARMQIVQGEFLGDAEPPIEPKVVLLQQGSTELRGLKPGRWRVNVRNAQGGPNNADPGQDQEVVVEAGATAKATFEVD